MQKGAETPEAEAALQKEAEAPEAGAALQQQGGEALEAGAVQNGVSTEAKPPVQEGANMQEAEAENKSSDAKEAGTAVRGKRI